jgi:AcrR family transcriptional regulator
VPRRADDRSATRANPRLSREGIVTAAVALADEGGRDGLTNLSMRRLAQHLGVDAMSIYYHLRDKDALLSAMADAVVAEIPASGKSANAHAHAGTAVDAMAEAAEFAEAKDAVTTAAGLVTGPGEWTGRLGALIMAARETMLRHPWAAGVLEGRETPTPAVMRHLERVLAILRGGGCSLDLSHHAIHLLGSRILGFSQDLFDDSPDSRPAPEVAAAQALAWAETMPHIAELAAAVSHDGALGGCDDDGEFAFALDLLLDGLERRRQAESLSGT